MTDSENTQNAAPQGGDAQKDVKAEYHEAKARYKAARKAAGKSNKPMVIGIIVLVLVVAAASAFGTWFFMTNNAAPSPEPQAAEPASSSSSASSASSSASDEAPDADGAFLLGEWEGDMESTAGGSYGVMRCYGGEDSPLKIQFEDVSSNGRITANAVVTYHGHEANLSKADAKTTSGDTRISLDDLTSTYDKYGFTFVAPANRTGDEVTIKVVPVSSASGTELEVTVTSEFDGAKIESDEFVLKKID